MVEQVGGQNNKYLRYGEIGIAGDARRQLETKPPKGTPHSPHAVLDPAVRWFPADEALRETTMDKLMPPLVARLRRKVKEFFATAVMSAPATPAGGF